MKIVRSLVLSFKKTPHRFILKAVYILSVFTLIAVFAVALLMRKVFQDIPSIDALTEYQPSLSTYLYDINENIITEFSVEKRTILPLSKIPINLQNALIAMEDRDFFNHWGISVKGITRAFLRDVLHRKVKQGGSTITQQLAKLIFLKPERTITRKIKEIFIAFQIEHKFSKQEILQMYFNQIYFGEGTYGAQTASRVYFGKNVWELNLAECALLVGLIPAPARYSPFNNSKLALWRRNLVLKQMWKSGFITEKEYYEALKEKLPEKKSLIYQTEAPYFSEYIRQMLEPKYGVKKFWQGGLRIYTTLDLNMQQKAEEIFDKKMNEYQERINKEFGIDLSSMTLSDKLQGAFLVIESKTGSVKVMIGGRDYKESQFNRVTQAKRQAGSTFKPFVWLSALLNDYTPATIIQDEPMAFYYDSKSWHLIEDATDQMTINNVIEPFLEMPDFKVWVPSNFDGKFLGKITLRKGLEKSRNLASVYLVNKLTPQVVADVAYRTGITSQLDVIPSIGLGTSLVNVFEMVSSFNTFSNEGIRIDPISVIKVTDSNGKILEENFPKETEAFKPQEVFLLVNMMKGVVQRGTAKVVSDLKRPIAGKTGTTQDSKDLWFIGFTPDVTAGAWVGFDDFSKELPKKWTGGSIAAPLWGDIMKEILTNYPVRDFPVPDNIVFVNIDEDSGKIALPKCKHKIMEAFIKGTEPKEFCDLAH